ncbi:MAG TPA: hypothetical protein DGH68_12030 [Bacteroidetes bacterium]|jgi:hypothetical protein|nr:hypothetical protein [Bacteroidota bacterium]
MIGTLVPTPATWGARIPKVDDSCEEEQNDESRTEGIGPIELIVPTLTYKISMLMYVRLG